MTQIQIVAIGGSTRVESSTELALRIAGRAAERAGAAVTYVTGPDLILPMYDINDPDRQPVVKDFIESVRQADGLILASPGYHGGMSGLFKNAMDYLEDLREDERPYLHNRAVGCISTAYGWQAAVATLQQLRQITHALRGWPTPMGGAINSLNSKFDKLAAFQRRTAGKQPWQPCSSCARSPMPCVGGRPPWVGRSTH